MQKITLVLHNIRSTYNVGSITRSAECLGVEKIYATGYTPHTSMVEGIAPFVLDKMKKSIHKTALGAEEMLPIFHEPNLINLLEKYRKSGYKIIALEQHKKSVNITNFVINSPIVLILGEEVNGITNEILKMVDKIIEIPMLGKKESFNVSVATGIALFEIQRNFFIEQ